MVLETKNKTINLVFKIKRIIDISNFLKNKNFEEAFVKAYSICDIEALVKILYTVAETSEGDKAFKTYDEVYDFVDECRLEQINVNELYKKIAEALNEEGFFKKKMSEKELAEITSNPLSTINMNELVHNSAQKAIETIATEQFQGYMA